MVEEKELSVWFVTDLWFSLNIQGEVFGQFHGTANPISYHS
jgi:hypothetical protein